MRQGKIPGAFLKIGVLVILALLGLAGFIIYNLWK